MQQTLDDEHALLPSSQNSYWNAWCIILNSLVLGVMIEMVHCFHDCLAMSVLMHMQREDTDWCNCTCTGCTLTCLHLSLCLAFQALKLESDDCTFC